MPTPTRDVFGMALLLLVLRVKSEGPMEEATPLLPRFHDKGAGLKGRHSCMYVELSEMRQNPSASARLRREYPGPQSASLGKIVHPPSSVSNEFKK